MTSRPPPPAGRRDAGFTLVELLVSLAVFGMIAGASALLLATSVDAQARVAARLDRSAMLRRTAALFAADLAQAVARPTRDARGGVRPSFAGGGDGPLFGLVRGGWDNPDDAPRPDLQRVEWRVTGDALVRIAHDRLDGDAEQAPVRFVTDLVAASARYRGADGWRPAWDATDPSALPRAVELTLTFADGRTIVQRWPVAT